MSPCSARVLWSVLALFSTATTTPIAFAAPLRNVVVIVADDLGMQLGCYGDTVAKTPNLDRRAAEGIRFQRGCCTTASCSAIRSVLVSGLYNHATGRSRADLPMPRRRCTSRRPAFDRRWRQTGASAAVSSIGDEFSDAK